MNRKLLLIALVLAAALTVLGLRHGLSAAAPSPAPGHAPPIEEYATHFSTALVTPTWRVILGGGGKDIELHDVDMVSPEEGWAVGVTGPTSFGVMMHYTNTTWSRVSHLTGTYGINAVKMISPTEGWAVGYVNCSYGCDHNLLLHYTTNTGWQTATLPASPGPDSRQGFFDLDIKGTTGWAVGGYAFYPDNNYFFQFDGSGWTPITAPLQTGVGVSVIDANEAWAVGGGSLAHYLNSHWLYVSPGLPANTFLQGIDMLDANEGWAVGYTRVSVSPSVYQCTIVHYTGGTWVPIPCSSSSRLYSVGMRSANDVWAVGENGLVLHYNGSVWSQVPVPAGTASLRSVRLEGADDGWIVGSGGMILRLVGGNWVRVAGSEFTFGGMDAVGPAEVWYGGVDGQLVQWQNGMLVTRTTPVAASINVLEMVSPTLGWAYARSNTGRYILKYSDVGWTVVPTTAIVSAISAVASEDAWFVMDTRSILHYHSGTWQYESVPLNSRFYSISMLDADHGWAVGNGVYTYSAGSWVAATPPLTDVTVSTIIAVSPDEAWVAGYIGACTPDGCPISSRLYHFAGGMWEAIPTPDWQIFYSISKVSATEWWATGRLNNWQYAFLHYKDGDYAIVPAVGEDVTGVSMLPDGSGFARGVGSLLQLNIFTHQVYLPIVIR
jgi:hypothetical protein